MVFALRVLRSYSLPIHKRHLAVLAGVLAILKSSTSSDDTCGFKIAAAFHEKAGTKTEYFWMDTQEQSFQLEIPPVKLDIRLDCIGVDWKAIANTLKSVGMAHHEPERHKRAFEASHTTVFIYHADRLIGFGRAISDGIYQAAVYDCAVLPEFQGQGIGSTIMNSIMDALPDCNVILYASPGKEAFYQKLGFRRMKTGMARFIKCASMRTRGFTD